MANYPANAVRKIWHGAAAVFFSICFFARIPYYKIFNSAFNMMLVNGMYDDKAAILDTAINEYQLLWRLPCAIFFGLFIIWLLTYLWKHTAIVDFTDIKRKKLAACLLIVFMPAFWIFVRYGGTFRYADSINWESAARLKSNLLNEAVLDDGQALYRVYSMKKRLDKVTDVNITVAELRNKIAAVGGDMNAADVDSAFLRTVKSPKLAHQPKQIVVIIGESFGLWPFLPEFSKIGLVNKTEALITSPKSCSVNTMLAHGVGTMSAINGLITGLPDAGLYENYQPNSRKTVYKMGIGYIMQQLGYKTVFWYGGFSGWQNIKNYVLAQSFNEFHCADEFEYSGGNSWGCPDKILFSYVENYIKHHKGDKICHIILTTSNHPPYSIDIDKEGFPRTEVVKKLPADISKEKETINELGHFWYADQAMGNFITRTEQIVPDILFVITGDHSERFNFVKAESIKTLSAIPCIFYGNNVCNNWVPANQSACTMQIPGTIAEIVAPAGFKYSSILPSMFGEYSFVFNHKLYAKNGHIGVINKSSDKSLRQFIGNARGVATWRVMKGNELK